MLAELGTVSLEYLTLARHTKEARYESVVKKIYDSVEKASTWDGMLPTMMRMDTGQPSHGTYTMSGSGDSYYEYLLKNWILTGKKDERYRRLYNAAMEGITKHLLLRSPGSGLLYTGEGEKNAVGDSMGHLACFTGGMIALGVLHKVNPATSERDLKNAKALAWGCARSVIRRYTCYRMYKSTATGISGESMSMNGAKPEPRYNQAYYILRPEALETMYYLNQITGDPIYREWGWEMWSAVEKFCRVRYGYSSMDNVNRIGSFTNGQESFFFAETLKYSYLLLKDDKVVDLTKSVFNTEGHPLSVFCCVCFARVSFDWGFETHSSCDSPITFPFHFSNPPLSIITQLKTTTHNKHPKST